MSSLMLAAWILGGVAAPCMATTCARVQHERCCCGSAGDCCCRLSSPRAPAPSAGLITAKAAQDSVSLQAAERNDGAGGSPDPLAAARFAHRPARTAQPIYLSTHAFRC